MKLYAAVLPLVMLSPDWVGISCINLFVIFEYSCVAPYCTRKENIWVGTPFGSFKLYCDPILLHKLSNAAAHRKNRIWLILWGLYLFLSRKMRSCSLKRSLKYFSSRWCKLHQKILTTLFLKAFLLFSCYSFCCNKMFSVSFFSAGTF